MLIELKPRIRDELAWEEEEEQNRLREKVKI